MTAFVQGYLDGTLSRMDFDLDFSYNLMKCYPAMEREDIDLAECFNYYIAEEGFDKTGGLSDTEHKKWMRRKFKEFNDVMRDGFY